jgi:hypothetical protein
MPHTASRRTNVAAPHAAARQEAHGPSWKDCCAAACGATTLFCRAMWVDVAKSVRSANNILRVLF